MKNLRLILPSLLLTGLMASGCWLISGQFTVSQDLPTPLDVDSQIVIVGAHIDLNTQSTYRDHKNDLKDLADCALLGTFTNTGTGTLDILVYMTPAGSPLHTTKVQLDADATKIKVWGPLTLGPGASKKVGWDESAGLFNADGKQALLKEVKGDGDFALYAVGASAPYKLRLTDGVAVVVVDAGK